MDNQLLEKEKIENGTNGAVEDITDEVNNLRKTAEAGAAEQPIEDILADPDAHDKEDAVDESADETSDEAVEAEAKGRGGEVAPLEKGGKISSDEPEKPVESDESSLPFFKTIKWKRFWDKYSFAILALLTAIPSLILAYVLIYFFML